MPSLEIVQEREPGRKKGGMMESDRLIPLLKEVEGFRSKAYWDVRQWTYGFGCRAPGKDATISKADAEILLIQKIDEARGQFARAFAGHLSKFNEARTEAFVEMVFQMGIGVKGGIHGLLSFHNTINLIKIPPVPNWKKVAHNLRQSLWARQTPERAARVTRQVETGEFQDYQ